MIEIKSSNKIFPKAHTKQTLSLLLIIYFILLNNCVFARDSTNDEWDVSQEDDHPQFDGVDSQFNQQVYDQKKGQQIQYQKQATTKGNLTAAQKLKQQKQLLGFYKQYPNANMFYNFAFQIKNQYQQFNFHLPTDHQVYLTSRVYVLKQNIYGQVKDIQSQPAVHLVVYENNHRIIAQHTFYFNNAIKISGKAKSTYMIRYFSPSHKLIVVTHNSFVQTSHFEGKIQGSRVRSIDIKLFGLNNKLKQLFKNLRTTYHVQFQERQQMTEKINRFASFQIIEIVLVILVCIFQIKMVSRLFKTDTII